MHGERIKDIMLQEKYTIRMRLSVWFGLAALVFGAFCGGAMASGAYAFPGHGQDGCSHFVDVSAVI